MRLLLDTDVVLRTLADGPPGGAAGAAIDDAIELHVSVLCYAEVGIKSALGKLAVPDHFAERVARLGATTLGLTAEHGLAVADLPLHHRDPFDRLLVAQARAEGLTIITSDRQLAAFDVAIVLA